MSLIDSPTPETKKKINELPLTVIKRDGRRVDFKSSLIHNAVKKAVDEVGGTDGPDKYQLDFILNEINSTVMTHAHVQRDTSGKKTSAVITVEKIQDCVESVLMKSDVFDIAKAYILYRDKQTRRRDESKFDGAETDAKTTDAMDATRQYFGGELEIFQFMDKYSRFIPEKGRRESWPEAVERVIEYFHWHVNTILNVPAGTVNFAMLRSALLKREALPAMRVLQMAGPAAKRCQVSCFNCSYLSVSSIRDFSEAFYILMQGTGVGFSVEYEYAGDLPKVSKQKKLPPREFVVEDSTEGWCAALSDGLEAWWSGNDINFDVSKVRPAGAKLFTKGGRASGPGPLVELLNFAREIILGRQGRRLSDLDVHRIMCKVGKIVQVGGVRRAAMIGLSDLDSATMRDAKSGAFWLTMPELTMANNSAVYDNKPTDTEFMSEWLAMAKSGSGERGIWNRWGVNQQIPKRRKKSRFGVNPCGEIVLKSRQFCNLSIPVIRPGDDEAEITRKVVLATIFGTLQASMTNFKFLCQDWKSNSEDEALLGVDLIGASDNDLLKPGNPDRDALFRRLRDTVVATNVEWAKRLGINPSAATTCIKPSGNSSVFLGAGNPITGWYAPYFIRRVRCNSISPVSQLLRDAGVPHAPEYDSVDPKNPAVWVFDFPYKAPEGALTKDDLSTTAQLENWLSFKKNWTEHNPSMTAYVGPGEWMDAGAWVLRNFESVGGLSFLPRDNGVYKLAPNEAITKQKYEELMAAFPRIPWEKLSRYEREDHTTMSLDYACVSGVCEI